MNKVLYKQVYSGFFEIVKDTNLYHTSVVDHRYNQLNDEGKEAVIEWFTLVAPKMLELEKQELDSRSKKMMWQELKK
jgi:hypothetical protein